MCWLKTSKYSAVLMVLFALFNTSTTITTTLNNRVSAAGNATCIRAMQLLLKQVATAAPYALLGSRATCAPAGQTPIALSCATYAAAEASTNTTLKQPYKVCLVTRDACHCCTTYFTAA